VDMEVEDITLINLRISKRKKQNGQ
jgi:hypothetical protein